MYLPTPTPITTNFYKSLATDEDDDDVTVMASNCGGKKEQIRPTTQSLLTRHTAWNTMKNTNPSIQIALDTAIADAGTTAHFILPGAPVKKRAAYTSSTDNQFDRWRHNQIYAHMSAGHVMAPNQSKSSAYCARAGTHKPCVDQHTL